MKWLIGIAVVMLVAHLYFRYGVRRLERKRDASEAEPSQRPPEG
ncbi:MAG TPA: hypothetical protein VGC20_09090 [bacterium]|jgi:hypothetical protein